jgi:hypothetical protein
MRLGPRTGPSSKRSTLLPRPHPALMEQEPGTWAAHSSLLSLRCDSRRREVSDKIEVIENLGKVDELVIMARWHTFLKARGLPIRPPLVDDKPTMRGESRRRCHAE